MTFMEFSAIFNEKGFSVVEIEQGICITHKEREVLINRDVLLMTIEDLHVVAKQVGDLL